MVLGDKQQILYGKGYIEDVLCGKTFRISSKSFYQVNPVQTEVLYNKAITYILTKFSLLNNILDFLPVGQVYKTLLPVGLLLGIGIGFVGSFFTIRKHLRV